MKRIIVTRTILGPAHMQVCAVSDATDEEILETCNKENPAGTQNGWSTVHHEKNEQGPVACTDFPEERIHYLVRC